MRERVQSLRSTESAAVSFNGWDNTRPNRALIGLVYHWVDSNWVYHQATLDVVTALAAHTGMRALCFVDLPITGEQIKFMMEQCVNERLHQTQLLSSAVTDNAAAWIKAARMLSGDNATCAAHTVQLAANTAIASALSVHVAAVKVHVVTVCLCECVMLVCMCRQ